MFKPSPSSRGGVFKALFLCSCDTVRLSFELGAGEREEPSYFSTPTLSWKLGSLARYIKLQSIWGSACRYRVLVLLGPLGPLNFWFLSSPVDAGQQNEPVAYANFQLVLGKVHLIIFWNPKHWSNFDQSVDFLKFQ